MTRNFLHYLFKEVHGIYSIPRKPPGKARRDQPARDSAYRQWIRSHPCADCGSESFVECAHVGDDGGMSQKASDYMTIPLCAECHRLRPGAYHRAGRRDFERRTGLDTRALARRMREEWSLEKAG